MLFRFVLILFLFSGENGEGGGHFVSVSVQGAVFRKIPYSLESSLCLTGSGPSSQHLSKQGSCPAVGLDKNRRAGCDCGL